MSSETAPRTRILLADDHELVVDMLRNLLEPEFEVVGAAKDGAMLVELARDLAPDVILADVIMPQMGGLEAGRSLHAAGSTAKLVFLTMETDPNVAAQAFAVGAAAYLSKTSPAAELLRVMRLVVAGGQYLSPAIAGGDIKVLQAAHSADPAQRLSPREVEVVKRIVAGMSMKAVARDLGITPRTVAFHKYRAMEQLGLRNNAELIDFAVRHRLLGAQQGQPAGAGQPPGQPAS